MQSKASIEAWYKQSDPWGYETNIEDHKRKERLLEIVSQYAPYKRALDVGCGEGWITKDLPADEIHGYELSDEAASRFPENVKRVKKPQGKYDLVFGTGILYPQYDYKGMIDLVHDCASRFIILSNIKDWEVDVSSFGAMIYTEEFPYREYIQKVRVYDVLTA